MLRRFLLVAAAASVLTGLAPRVARAADQKIGFVDLEFALNNVEEGKKAKAVLEQDYKKKKEELDATAAALAKMKEDLKGQTLVLTDDARRQKEQELSAAQEKFAADSKAARDAWQKREDALTKDLLERLTMVVQQLGKDGGYTFILERHDASVLYAKDDVDLTRQVIERFNKTGGRP
ncbi:MAG TPA: OmpH family outer membrane protein [bacterium]|nr:OmpH family outer membrane protein [bacterium]